LIVRRIFFEEAMIKKSYFTLIITIILQLVIPAQSVSMKKIVEGNLNFAVKQYGQILVNLDTTNELSRSFQNDGILSLVSPDDWTSGFFPGSLWYLYDFTKDSFWKKKAEFYSAKLEKEQYNTQTHDVGFMINCSFGNGYRLIDTKEYKNIIIRAAKSLSKRFRPIVGCIQSWGSNNRWECPVIIDNMMNLELLFNATKLSGDSVFYQIAVTHANTTIKNHFRPDNSSYHVINYDTLSGKVLAKNTAQGYSDNSAWARGQAWGLYGFTMTYRETHNKKYLNQAQRIADFILNNKNLPDDMVPYWDFDAPNIPGEPRDASAAAIICSALYEVSSYSGDTKEGCREAADKILRSLSSDGYRSDKNENGNFILKNSVGSKPADSEVNVPLIYADYYFIEANLRCLNYNK
jgi:unsaturated chondroitin disaccharide hydrolase